jgi:hypothetical protein
MGTQLATIGGDVDLSGFSGLRLKPAELKLLQNTTPDMKGGQPGEILDTRTEESAKIIEVVLLRRAVNRAYFPGAYSADSKPICTSNDGIVPSKFAEHPQAAKCVFCPHSKWIAGKKPPCAEKRRLLFVMKDTGLPRLLTFGGSAIPVFKKDVEDRINESITMLNYRDKTKRYYPYDFSFTISSKRVVTNRGTYYEPVFGKPVLVENVGEFGPLYQEFVVNYSAAMSEEGEAVDNETTVDAAVGETIVMDAEIVHEV